MDRPRYIWPEGKRSAACFSVDVDAEAPYLWAHRAGLPPHLGQLEQRHFGPREGIWRILDMLDRVGIKGSFYVPSVVAELHPELLPALCERGHEIGLHGHLHELVAEITDDQFQLALDRSLDVFKAQTGMVPCGFRSPAWEMTPAMITALKSRGLRYDSSLMGYDHPYEIGGLVQVPVQWQIDDAIYFKFQGGGADRWPPEPARAVEAGWRDEFEAGRDFGQLFTITVHPWVSGRAQRVAMLERVLTHIAVQDDVWFATASRIAEWHLTANAGRFVVETGLDTLAARLDQGARA
ncbi:polysaccharide deacetylase family protein [Paracoccus onubensis]|uniref:Chitooligosaccharide deacetylase n=1 Tax=Paracoccus onubensis TaxID=1675788 RepID=A0A418SVI3_9RHOB|nr:polysaccharide deacetylase [Paracoccus onubensis]RJE84963.1 polysaccharide deacetylase [Paracoccus onubensis]